MLSLGSLAFASPWLLLALIGAPILWWLLRVTPPAPAVISFPAIRLLIGLRSTEETPAKTPLWLILMRLLLALLLILGMAHPLLHPSEELPATGPLLLVIDDDWAAAKGWADRQRFMRDLVARADRESRKVIVLTTSKDGPKDPAGLKSAAQAQAMIATLRPHPWAAGGQTAVTRLAQLSDTLNPAIFWLSDGLDTAGSADLAKRLAVLGQIHLVLPPSPQLPRLLTLASTAGPNLTVRVIRPSASGPGQFTLQSYGSDGALLDREQKSFAPGTVTAEVPLNVPLELRNRVERVALEGEATAAATLLLDNSSRRGAVGIVTDRAAGASQPLLSGAYYVGRALEPYAELRRGTLDTLAKDGLGMMVLPDGDIGASEVQAGITKWVENGGVLLRFAGPELADTPEDSLLPVTLRRGGRSIGGVMSWENPAHLAPFPQNSPFFGLTIPPDVMVTRQVLAEPSVDLDAKTWARLSDGTPLVTGERRGKGWVVLVHTSASSTWSNLVLSGLFVDMLKRLSSLGSATAGTMKGTLPPWRSLDAFGHLETSPATARPIDAATIATATPDSAHPPGYYGMEDAHMALNLGGSIPWLIPLHDLPRDTVTADYAAAGEVDLRPLFLSAALILALIDLLVSYAMRGMVRFNRRAAASITALLLMALMLPSAAIASPASPDDAFAINATKQLHLGYIITGDDSVDATTKAGLEGLDDVLQRRTAVETGDPVGVDIERNELIFFPLIYWPITPDTKPLSPAAVERVNRYLDTGGTFLIDTRDQGTAAPGAGEENAQRLRTIFAGVHLPSLVPVPPDHVLTRSFYLLQDFPGRWLGGTLWVEPADDHVNDGVSTIVMGSNDWASAWAIDANGDPQFPVVPGGEAQREQAYRFGVNLVMYALTGNYKADQVHVPAILERLGQ